MKVIIVGAGAAGLMAAKTLSEKGVEVIVLEAQDYAGGRIHTLRPKGFTNHIEAGAEFIHGKLPVTLGLLRKAGVHTAPVSGKMYSWDGRRFKAGKGSGADWEEFADKAKTLKRDCPVSDLLSSDFAANRYKSLRQEIRDMAQGLDLADIDRLSTFSIRSEWASGETEYRPVGGYQSLIEFLVNQFISRDCQLLLNHPVKRITWRPGSAEVETEKETFHGDAVVLTIPLPLYKRQAISFDPPIDDLIGNFSAFGHGEVIKIAMEFAYPFWEKVKRDLGFLFTETGFTFWSQLSLRRPLLYAWLGADHAPRMNNFSDEEIVHQALQALSEPFKTTAKDLDALLRAGAVFRYMSDGCSGGGYSYLTPDSKAAFEKIKRGRDKTLWFAGEALAPDLSVATVEAALKSGLYTAKQVLAALMRK